MEEAERHNTKCCLCSFINANEEREQKLEESCFDVTVSALSNKLKPNHYRFKMDKSVAEYAAVSGNL